MIDKCGKGRGRSRKREIGHGWFMWIGAHGGGIGAHGCGLELMEEGSELLDMDRSRRCWGAGVRSQLCLDEQSTHRRMEGMRTAI